MLGSFDPNNSARCSDDDISKNSDDDISKNSSEHLWKIGNILSSTCPAASRFYMCNLERNLSEAPDLLKIGSKREHVYCKHCGSLWSPGKYSVRILPCPYLNQHLKKLLKVEAEQPWRLNNHQKKKLNKFKASSNKIVYRCFICKRKTVFPGDKRPHINHRASASSSTPSSKIKLKKGDFNAGLFIPSPSCPGYRNQNYKEMDKPGFISHTQGTKTPKSSKATTHSESTISSGQKKSSAKKRKTLLDQILKQEQNSTKKPSLSSFLVSLT